MTERDQPGEVTELLKGLEDSPETLDRIMSMVYKDIHRIAHHQRGFPGIPTPQTTVLVHEAFMKLFGKGFPEIRNRTHLKRMAAMAVRQLIVDRARFHLSQKRGSGARHTDFNDQHHHSQTDSFEYVMLVEQALARLEELDPELAQLIVGTYYGGYSAREMSEITGLSERSVQRQLKRARGWLRLELEQQSS